MPDDEEGRFPGEQLKDFSTKVFVYYGVPQADAEQAAEVLIASDLRGIDSHGVARLPVYVEMLAQGRINPRPQIRIVRDKFSVASIDADNGLGLVVGPKANEIAMAKAEKYGSGWVSVSNSSHFGIAGYYPLRALERGLIGWAMTNASRLVAPLWGAERMLGTNPIAIAFPGLEEPPVVIDLATSAASYGKVEIARRKKTPVPSGWIMDKNGQPTVNPDDLLEGGALLPLGSEKSIGGHKGYALAVMVDMLSGVLSGANWGPFVPPFAVQQPVLDRNVGKGIGHLFGALQIEAFIDQEEFRRRVDAWIRTLRKTKPAPGTMGPLIPGDPEREAEYIRSRMGVPLSTPVLDGLLALAAKTGIALA
jgi:LDH2 family malate/lactate/ureidoglycolate dehydrogenase